MTAPLPMAPQPIVVRGACPHDCPDTCATRVHVLDGRAVKFEADPDHPVTRGWLCAKVRPYLDRVYSPDRLTHPLRRVGPKGGGEWQRISWDEAISEITGRWQAIIAEHGPAAILPYSFSGTLGIIQMGLTSARLWNRMGVSGLQRSICGAAAETAVAYTLGGSLAPAFSDVQHAKLLIIWGNNPASTNPHFMPFLQEAQRNGTELIVIDPRRTTTARRADLHLRPNPATDGALALGLMHVLFAENLHDETWLRAHALGWEALRERTREYPPERVAAITGIDADTIVALARRYGTTKPALLKFADGIQRHGNGGQTVRAMLCLPAVTGQYGVRGGGLLYSTGGWVSWDAETYSRAGECPPPPRWVNMNRLGRVLNGEISDPPIQSLYVFGANPVTSTPNASETIRGLRREDLFTVVHEQFMTDTAHYADIVLPATTQLEQTDLHKPYGNRHLQYNHQAIAPLAEAKSNWEVQHLLAAGMGYTEPWLHQSVEEAIEELLENSRAANPTLAGITLERLQREGTVAYAYPEDNPEGIPFRDGVFPTPSGKIELWCEAMRAEGQDPLPEYTPPAEFQSEPEFEQGLPPLVLISAAAHHFVSSTFSNQPKLAAKEGEPFVELNPLDAAARGIGHGDLVTVSNRRGSCQLRAIVSDDTPPGVAAAPKGYWGRNSPDQRNINWTTSDGVADLAGQATYHSNRVQIWPVETALTAREGETALSVAD